MRYDFQVGMAPGPDFFAKIARDQGDEQIRLKHYWRLQKAYASIRNWGKVVQKRLRGLEGRAGLVEQRVNELERKLKSSAPTNEPKQ